MTKTVQEKTLETLIGPLAETFPQLERATILHADDLTTARRTDKSLRRKELYTADSNLYTVEKGESIWYLGREPTNLIFNNIEQAIYQLITTGDYIPLPEDIEAVKGTVEIGETLRVKLSDLKLQGNESAWRYFEIDNYDYDSLNEHQRKVAERVYGRGEDFVQNMEIFRQNIRNLTRIYVLNPDYVKKNAPQDGALARVSVLDDFAFNSTFGADGKGDAPHAGLRGIRNVA